MGTANFVLNDFIQKAPEDVVWHVDFDTFFSALTVRPDSGCGPDGVPYSFWSLAPLEFSKAIYDNYLALKDGQAMNMMCVVFAVGMVQAVQIVMV